MLHVPAGIRLCVKQSGDKHYASLGFLKGNVPTAVPITTNVGALYLSLFQNLSAQPAPARRLQRKKYRLRTDRYAYRILESDDPNERAKLRWEYDKAISIRKECRYHMHPETEVAFGEQALRLDCHLPTGYVLIEHIVQFLFHDLGVQSRNPDGWPTVLYKSVGEFHKGSPTARSSARISATTV